MLVAPAGRGTVVREAVPKPVWLANAFFPSIVTEAVPVNDSDSA